MSRPLSFTEILFTVMLALVSLGFAMPILIAVCFWAVAWLIFLYLVFSWWTPLRRLEFPFKVLGGYFASLVALWIGLYPVAWRYDKEKAAATTGHLSIHQPLLLNLLKRKEDYRPPIWEIGPGVTLFVDGPKMPILRFGNDSLLLIDRDEYSDIVVSAVLRDVHGNIVLEIDKNAWEVSSDKTIVWDKNYRDNMLEVLNGEGRVVFQLRMFHERVALNGIWYLPAVDGSTSNRVSHAFLPGRGDSIPPIFLYPSSDHWGELRGDNEQSVIHPLH